VSNVQQELQITNIYSEAVNNPYLKLFYQIMIEPDIFKVFEEYARGATLINIFDFVALACKYLDSAQLKQIIHLKIESSIQKGNLDALVLTGLSINSSKQVAKLIQGYIDMTSDIQTAAYVAAYASSYVITKSTVKVPKASLPQLLPFKRFLHVYREYLNTLQLFYVRAKFDCAHNRGLIPPLEDICRVPITI